MKTCPLRVALFHADRQADRRTGMKLTVDFHNFLERVYKNETIEDEASV
jgi:hypothetical protein